MSDTPLSLLERVKQTPTAAGADWRVLHDIYTPLIRATLTRLGIRAAELDDLSQNVWQIIVRKLPSFTRQRDGSFRTWLRVLTTNEARGFWRTRTPTTGHAEQLAALEDPQSGLSQQFDADHDRYVFAKLLQLIRADFSEQSWQLFEQFAIERQPAATVATTCNVSVAVVLQTKSRILRRLRAEAAELMD